MKVECIDWTHDESQYRNGTMEKQTQNLTIKTFPVWLLRWLRRLKEFATEAEDLGSIPETYMVKEETQLSQAVFLPYMCGADMYTQNK